jgi:hypothetical protein
VNTRRELIKKAAPYWVLLSLVWQKERLVQFKEKN